MMNKGLKAWVIETNYRVKLKAALKKSSDTELVIMKEELEKKLIKRRKA